MLTVEASANLEWLVLEVGTNTREVNNDRDVGLLEQLLRANTASLQNLWCVNGTSSEDDLALGLDCAGLALVSGVGRNEDDSSGALVIVELDLEHTLTG